MTKKMQTTTTATNELVLCLLEVDCIYYTGGNVVRKVKKRLQHVLATNDDNCMQIAFVCMHLEGLNDIKDAKKQLEQRRSWFGVFWK